MLHESDKQHISLDGTVLSIIAKQGHKGVFCKCTVQDSQAGTFAFAAFNYEGDLLLENIHEGDNLKCSIVGVQKEGFGKDYYLEAIDHNLLKEWRKTTPQQDRPKRKLSEYLLEGFKSYGWKRVPIMRYVGGPGKIATSWLDPKHCYPIGNQRYDGILFTRWVEDIGNPEHKEWTGQIYPKELESELKTKEELTNCPF